MREILSLFVMLSVCLQPLAFAAEPTPETGAVSLIRDTGAPSQKPQLRTAIEHEAMRLALSLGKTAAPPSQQPPRGNRAWIRRHPALFGALMGTGLGAASSAVDWTELYCANGGDEDCLFHGGAGVLFGAGAGAGIGALIGFLVGK